MKHEKPELSRKNPYFLPKYRYLELKNFCFQYNDWKRALARRYGWHCKEQHTIWPDCTRRNAESVLFAAHWTHWPLHCQNGTGAPNVHPERCNGRTVLQESSCKGMSVRLPDVLRLLPQVLLAFEHRTRVTRKIQAPLWRWDKWQQEIGAKWIGPITKTIILYVNFLQILIISWIATNVRIRWSIRVGTHCLVDNTIVGLSCLAKGESRGEICGVDKW